MLPSPSLVFHTPVFGCDDYLRSLWAALYYILGPLCSWAGHWCYTSAGFPCSIYTLIDLSVAHTRSLCCQSFRFFGLFGSPISWALHRASQNSGRLHVTCSDGPWLAFMCSWAWICIYTWPPLPVKDWTRTYFGPTGSQRLCTSLWS